MVGASGRDYRCRIDPYFSDDDLHVFVHLEDHGRAAEEWDEHGLFRRTSRTVILP